MNVFRAFHVSEPTEQVFPVIERKVVVVSPGVWRPAVWTSSVKRPERPRSTSVLTPRNSNTPLAVPAIFGPRPIHPSRQRAGARLAVSEEWRRTVRFVAAIDTIHGDIRLNTEILDNHVARSAYSREKRFVPYV